MKPETAEVKTMSAEKLRRVTVEGHFKYFPRVRIPKYEGWFHQFGTDYEELENGAGFYTTAIVENDDGTVESVDLKLIRFLDKPNAGGVAINSPTLDSELDVEGRSLKNDE